LVVRCDRGFLDHRGLVGFLEHNHGISGVAVHGGDFEDPDPTLDRLFGEVLPGHPSAVEIDFAVLFSVSPRYIGLLAAGIARGRRENQPPIERLGFRGVSLDDAGIGAISSMLRDGGRVLGLRLTGSFAYDYSLQPVFEALEGNEHLRRLQVEGVALKYVGPAGWSALNSSLVRYLEVGHGDSGDVTLPLPSDGWANLVEALKTNTVIQELVVHGFNDIWTPVTLLEDVLSAFNFSLETVTLHYPPPSRRLELPRRLPQHHRDRIDELLRVNARVRAAHAGLEALPDPYSLQDRSLWARTLATIGS
jgi:hypothetical protein